MRVRACLRVRRCQTTCSIKSPVDLAVVIAKCHYSFHENLNMNMGEKRKKKRIRKIQKSNINRGAISRYNRINAPIDTYEVFGQYFLIDLSRINSIIQSSCL